ncbi:MAG: helix-hairpin-helix domain-containing protein [Betaproteobacteria bacterium]|jgi:competence protein ComEA|nr:helix-hairpin-helix domain-containing protein [Betaproteobacteria bacterium]MBK7654080.1 helix-hairpin-helix domain-containing protein [Betaproteobacteria bacterium]
MLKKFLTAGCFLLAAMSYAAVDVNTATPAELDSIKGIGPGATATILAERNKGLFKDWADFESRVKGVKGKRAAKLSDAGLTVSGTSYGANPATEKSALSPTAFTASGDTKK